MYHYKFFSLYSYIYILVKLYSYIYMLVKLYSYIFFLRFFKKWKYCLSACATFLYSSHCHIHGIIIGYWDFRSILDLLIETVCALVNQT